ncbi:MAG: hypothetical protein WCE23_08000 [Candidatus Binatus sp.]|uniref:hypothetical protein n=1 Tax=Candidatus Binatus sp. TaxID=2811406 RepID=UPI003C74C038
MANDSPSVLIECVLNCRCPVCRNGAIFRSHFRMNRECPRCHVVFWKDPGETLGAMYLDFAVASGAFLIGWVILAFATRLSDAVQMFFLSAIAAGSVLLCHPLTRSAWTMLVYLSGGIERPRLRTIQGGKKAS